MERRITGGSECRIERREDGTTTAIGYAAVFHRNDDPGTEYELYSDTVERIEPGAFKEAIGRPDDVRGLFNHNSSNLLGRTTADTLRITEDSRGLRYEIDLPDTSVGRDVATSIERGDLTGSSFAFVPESIEWKTEGERDVRTIKSVRLYDVGPVTFPAYGSTSTSLRSDGHNEVAKSEQKAWREEHRRVRLERIYRARVKMLDVDGR